MLSTALLFLAAASSLPWSELSLTVERDQSVSSDQATIVRVRVVNHGSHTWPGRDLAFEVHAIESGAVVARQRGRFGLSLAPRGELETLVGFLGRYERFEVQPVEKPASGRRRSRRR